MAYSKKEEFSARLSALARYAKAVSHPARISILETLAKKNSCICGEIVEGLPLAQSTVSQHLKELKDSGLITGEIDGLKSCYCLNPAAVKELEAVFGALLKNLNRGLNLKNCC